ncbi:AraC family transcriptional regulator [Humidesulfovibrio sp.]
MTAERRGQRTGEAQADQAQVWSPPQAPGLTLLRARFRTQTFARHSHEGYGVGVIEAGALAFDYRGAGLVAGQGAVNTVNPDEPHTGHAATSHGWAYRMFYFSPEYLAQVAEDVAGRPVPLPFFTSGVIHDPALAALLLRAHALHDRQHSALPGSPAYTPTGALPDAPSGLPGGDSLARESLVLHAFARLLARHSYLPPPLPRVGAEHAAVARVKAHLLERIGLGAPGSPFSEIEQPGPDGNSGLTLAELARVACLSPYHFIRVFARHTGLPPHAWLMQLRARKAGELLRQGAPIAQAAAGAGFADQSHLTKTFKRLLGYTPGQFRNSVQGA